MSSDTMILITFDWTLISFCGHCGDGENYSPHILLFQIQCGAFILSSEWRIGRQKFNKTNSEKSVRRNLCCQNWITKCMSSIAATMTEQWFVSFSWWTHLCVYTICRLLFPTLSSSLRTKNGKKKPFDQNTIFSNADADIFVGSQVFMINYHFRQLE